MRIFSRSIILAMGVFVTACGGQATTPTPPATVAVLPTATVVVVVGTATAAAMTATVPSVVPTAAATAFPVATATVVNATATVSATATAATAIPAPTATAVIAPTAAMAASTTTYVIAPMQSRARYTVNEQFANMPLPNDAVGETNGVTGQLVLGANGLPVLGGTITVDMSTLTSDRPPRDIYLRQNSLESGKFPTATFVVTSAEGMNAPLTATPTVFKLTGTMTLHGVTRPLTWETTASMDGDAISGTATTSFKMADFGITPPKLAVLTTSDMVRLDMKLVLTKKA